jgi:hypothetical protein
MSMNSIYLVCQPGHLRYNPLMANLSAGIAHFFYTNKEGGLR